MRINSKWRILVIDIKYRKTQRSLQRSTLFQFGWFGGEDGAKLLNQ